MELKRNKSWYIINWIAAILFFIAIMVVFSLTDKEITHKINDNSIATSAETFNNVFSAIGSTMLVLPIFFAVSALIQKLLTTKGVKYKNTLYWGLISILILISMVINFWTMITKPHDKEWTSWITMIVTGVVYLAIIVLYEWFFWTRSRKDERYINQQFWFGLRAVVFLVTIFVIVNIMKPLFGRPRPNGYLKGDEFRYPFEAYFGSNRGFSFPSGHTISAMSIFGITLMFYTKSSWQKYSLNSCFTVLVILVALSRILSLHHYTTDTVMSIGIGTLFYVVYRKLFNKYVN